MGEFVNSPGLQTLAWFVAALIAGLNAWFLVMMFR
jgi:Mn2+/Fe2+ NRAMP family transporter